ncbi:MAG: hypothetical protein ACRBBS_09725 [Thalassovita sp.]
MTKMKPGEGPNKLLKTLKEGKEVTVQSVRDDFDFSRRQAYNAIARLENRGYLKHIATSTWLPTAAGLEAVRDDVRITSGPSGPSGTIPRPKNTFRQRAWRSMRFRTQFTIGNLVTDAGNGDEDRERENAMRYVRQLRSAGIVAELPRRVKGTAIGSNGYKQFILLRDLGPDAPAFRAKKNAIHDFKSGEDFPCDQV